MTDPTKRDARVAPFVNFEDNSEQAARFDVVAVTSSGKRVIAGSCPTREAAESWVALLTKYGRLVGSTAFVEERGEKASAT